MHCSSNPVLMICKQSSHTLAGCHTVTTNAVLTPTRTSNLNINRIVLLHHQH